MSIYHVLGMIDIWDREGQIEKYSLVYLTLVLLLFS